MGKVERFAYSLMRSDLPPKALVYAIWPGYTFKESQECQGQHTTLVKRSWNFASASQHELRPAKC
eukprot:3292504-Pleurochrysis_carterae.AAC.1